MAATETQTQLVSDKQGANFSSRDGAPGKEHGDYMYTFFESLLFSQDLFKDDITNPIYKCI